MAKIKNLEVAPSGIYHLRIQIGGTNRRLSLKTKNPTEAKLAAAIAHATISNMIIDPNKIKGWTLETSGQNIKITTDNTPEDRASALEALKIIAGSQQQKAQDSYPSVIQNRKTITIGEALEEYRPHLLKTTVAEKTKVQAMSTVTAMVKKIGASFNIGDEQLEDEIQEKWVDVRLEQVTRATVKRELSFVRGFIEWAADRKRKYAKAPLTISINAINESYDYFSKSDLKAIFDNAATLTDPSRIWLLLLGLYTGARIGQICSIENSFFENVNGINIINFKTINKNKSSLRKIPIHQDLIDLGLLDFAEKQKKLGRIKLLTISGKRATKFFTDFKRRCGIDDPKKVFHSFRATAVDCLKQNGVGFDERCEYVGHSAGGGVHNAVYARNSFSIEHLDKKCVKLMDWQKYCGWSPDIKILKVRLIIS
jgi:integrase